ncbi:unnamed protein product, partial [Nippostrongylus brasiliensis]|uniref:GSK3-beta interaction protein (inferred by orthology to a human protein) n=1 Tax=Nippostrongylus brasiliensis TaxID=27835 RepID=A0A0N4YM83_NIPBR
MTNALNGDTSHYPSVTTPPTTPTAQPASATRSGNSGMCDCDMRSQLEEEAVSAVREYSYAVHSVCISEMLPRTSELLFLNLTTLEHATYCIELTDVCVSLRAVHMRLLGKGWRIASNRADCMNGDFRQLH